MPIKKHLSLILLVSQMPNLKKTNLDEDLFRNVAANIAFLESKEGIKAYEDSDNPLKPRINRGDLIELFSFMSPTILDKKIKDLEKMTDPWFAERKRSSIAAEISKIYDAADDKTKKIMKKIEELYTDPKSLAPSRFADEDIKEFNDKRDGTLLYAKGAVDTRYKGLIKETITLWGIYSKLDSSSKESEISELESLKGLMGNIKEMKPGESLEIQKKAYSLLRIPRSFTIVVQPDGSLDIILKVKSKDESGVKNFEILGDGTSKKGKIGISIGNLYNQELLRNAKKYADLTLLKTSRDDDFNWLFKEYLTEMKLSSLFPDFSSTLIAMRTYTGKVDGEDVRKASSFSPLAEYGDLKKAMKDGLTEKEKLSITKDLLLGLAHIGKKIVIQDVKPQNILVVDKNGERRAVFSDFGVAVYTGGTHIPSGTCAYMPQSLFNSYVKKIKTEIKPSHDLFSLGITIFEMFTGEKCDSIYCYNNANRKISVVDVEKLNNELKSARPKIPENIQELVRFLVTTDINKEDFTIEKAMEIYGHNLVKEFKMGQSKLEIKEKKEVLDGPKGFFNLFNKKKPIVFSGNNPSPQHQRIKPDQ